MWRPCRLSLGPGRPDESPAEGTVREDGAHRPGALGQGCKDLKPLRPIRCCSQHAKYLYRKQEKPYEQNARVIQSAYITSTYNATSKVQSTSQLVSINSYSYTYNHRKGLWFLTLIFNYSFISYCSDLPLYIIVITTYSNIKPLSRSVSLTNCLWNAPYLLTSYYTFYLNPR